MTEYYSVNVLLVNNKLDYQVPDTGKVAGIKYKWRPENKGIESSIQAECCFQYPDVTSETENIHSITEQEYLDFARVILSSNSSQMSLSGEDTPIITAEFPEAGGSMDFIITEPNGEQKTITLEILENRIVTLPAEHLTTTEIGTLRIQVRSNIWHTVSGFGTINIEVS